LLYIRGLTHKFEVFVWLTKAHDPLDTSAIIPAAVIEHDLAAGGQVLHIALEIPLAALFVCWLVQSDNAGEARVEMLGETLDCAALARSITPLDLPPETSLSLI